MNAMYRIIRSRMLILIRLVIVMSLAGYSLSTATAAMHGTPSFGISQTMPHSVDDAQMTEHDHGGKTSDSKSAKPGCCEDFCVSFAIIATADLVGGPVVSPIREFIDDSHVVGELVPLHRPPNI